MDWTQEAVAKMVCHANATRMSPDTNDSYLLIMVSCAVV